MVHPPPAGRVWFITGAGKHLYVRNVGAAPLQRHPMVAVTLVCVSVQVTAVRVAQIRAKFCTGPISPHPLRPNSSAMKGIAGVLRAIGLPSIFFSSRHLQIRVDAQNSLLLEPPGADERLLP